jgi:2'-phosphotransferase
MASVENQEGRSGLGHDDDPAPFNDADIDALGRTLVGLLRHKGATQGLKLRPDGYAPLSAVFALPGLNCTRTKRALASHSVSEVREAVWCDNKGRLGLLEEDGVLLIRANQGHSTAVVTSEALLTRITRARELGPVVVHSTFREFLPTILQEGLCRMRRNHVHFGQTDDLTSVRGGLRPNAEILIYLDVEKALAAELPLFLSDNGVVLSPGFGERGLIPPHLFAKIVDVATGATIPLPIRALSKCACCFGAN